MDIDVPFLKTLVFGLLSWRLNQCVCVCVGGGQECSRKVI